MPLSSLLSLVLSSSLLLFFRLAALLLLLLLLLLRSLLEKPVCMCKGRGWGRKEARQECIATGKIQGGSGMCVSTPDHKHTSLAVAHSTQAQ